MTSNDNSRDTSTDETVPCPRCNGSGEIDRPECHFVGCNEKMIQRINGTGWFCPVHHTMTL